MQPPESSAWAATVPSNQAVTDARSSATPPTPEGFDKPESGNERRSGSCSAPLRRTPRHVTTSSVRRSARAPMAGSSSASPGTAAISRARSGGRKRRAWSISAARSPDDRAAPTASPATGRSSSAGRNTSTGPRMGARWVDGRQEVFAGPDGFVGEAHGANSDASIVVGQTCRFTGSLDQSAWIWTARRACSASSSRAEARGAIGIMFSTSEDGGVIGGAHSFGLESDAVLWIDRSPSHRKDYLRTHGVPTAFDGWINTGFITGALSGWSHPCRLRRRTERFPGLHRDTWGPGHEPLHARRRLCDAAGVSGRATWGAIMGRSPAWPAIPVVCDRPACTRTESARRQRRVHVGVCRARFFAPRWGAEVLLMQQSSALRLGTTAGSTDLFTITTGQLQGSVVYRFSGADRRSQPFAFAGLGSTFFRSRRRSVRDQLSLGFGGGVNTSSPASLASADTSATNRPCSTTHHLATSAIRSDSARARCSRSSSPPVPWCVSSGREVSSTCRASARWCS